MLRTVNTAQGWNLYTACHNIWASLERKNKIERSAEPNFGYLSLSFSLCVACMTMIALQAALGFIFAAWLPACSFIKFQIRLEKPA